MFSSQNLLNEPYFISSPPPLPRTHAIIQRRLSTKRSNKVKYPLVSQLHPIPKPQHRPLLGLTSNRLHQPFLIPIPPLQLLVSLHLVSLHLASQRLVNQLSDNRLSDSQLSDNPFRIHQHRRLQQPQPQQVLLGSP